ncbi:MAG TPA: hypothetical protein V6C78_16010 [Crinalium sp.]|jgi:hypothetical protein
MSTATLPHTNGSKAHDPAESWLKQTAREFFSAINWDDHPPEVQELKISASQGNPEALSLLLSVSQFFKAVNWEDAAIAAPTTPAPVESNGADWGQKFTLEDFADLF